jgi:signal transduction histidine kinase
MTVASRLPHPRSKERSKVNATGLGEAVTRLSWLSPCVDSLVALARCPAADTWARIRQDPGAVVLVLRQAPAARAASSLSCFPSLVHEPAVLEGACRLLDSGTSGFVDWDLPSARPVYQASVMFARTAHWLAERSGRADPENAWVAGLLAPLGWLAACAVDLDLVGRCLEDPELASSPHLVEQRFWGLDHSAIARRLSRRWRLPGWMAAVAGHLDLPAQTAHLLGADPGVFSIVQLAVELVQHQENILHLTTGASRDQHSETLALGGDDLEELERRIVDWTNPLSPTLSWKAPHGVPLLRELVRLSAEHHRLAEAPVFGELEAQVDQLHRALHLQQTSENERLKALKLNALAEFAAGAGHEINNPLAVISGQAQYLLHHELDPARQSALETIVGQTQRIHVILSEVMQFARPPRPNKLPVDIPGILQDVIGPLEELAAHRQVHLACGSPAYPIHLSADPRQLRTALTCLVRNAVEAVPPDGWVRVLVHSPAPDRVDFIVEDSGNGPAPEQRTHLFDPFYSGRQAGRGRGLGLPTAWRLAREQGGDVRFEELPHGPTRFVLSLPLGSATTACQESALNDQPTAAEHGRNGHSPSAEDGASLEPANGAVPMPAPNP